jgi:peptide/nickel transport system substrate-binding protein
MNKRKTLGQVGRSTVLAAALAAAMVVGYAAAADAAGTLRIGRDQDTVTFDPVLTVANADIWILDNMNANLVRVTPDGSGLEADLAEKWTVSDDGKTYTFTMRPDLKFSDGSPITVADVKFSLERARDLETSVFGSMYKIMTSVETPDDKTVVIKLDKPSAPLLSLLAMFSTSITPEKAVKELGEEFASKPIGAGAFKLEEWKRGDRIVLVRNPNYWQNSRVKLDRVEWIVVPADNTRVLKLQAGEIDAAIFVPFAMVDQLKQDANIQVHLDPSSREDLMLINHTHKPLDDVRVRQAICEAIDREAILKTVLFGNGVVANSVIPAGALYYNKDNPTCKFDPAHAKTLLEQAGVKDLKLKFLISAGNVADEQGAVIIKDSLAKAGIEADIVKEEAGQAWTSMQAMDYDIALSYWTNDIIDPDQKITFSLYGVDANKSYFTGYSNPKVTGLIDQGRVEMDPGKRTTIYNEIQLIASQEVNWVDLYYSPFRNASRKTVKGFFQNPTGRFMLEDTEITQ